jgi:putative PIN family toxin of toxin-antitoxin system
VRAVLDANIWIRGFLRRASYPGQVVDAWRAHRFELVSSEPLLEEIADVLSRPKVQHKTGLTADQVALFLVELRSACHLVTMPGILRLCRDADDDAIIETAVVGNAAVIVSQDNDLLSLAIPGVPVLTAPEFLALLGDDPA